MNKLPLYDKKLFCLIHIFSIILFNKALKSRFEKAFVGRVCIPGSSYNIQNYLEMEGVYSIKVTPLGGNNCLLEELEEGFIGELIKEGETRWKSWFSVIEKWEAGMMDGRRDAWFRIYGIPIHVWCSDFFVSLGELWGRFLCIDDNTSKGEAFDVARILVNIPLSLCLPDFVPVCIDMVNYNLCIREDAQSPYRHVDGNQKVHSSDGDTSDSDFERLMVESDSDCSDEPEGMEVKEGLNSGDLNKKEEAFMDNHCLRHSGGIPEAGTRGKFVASSGVDSEGNYNLLDCSDSRSDSDVKCTEDEIICKAHAEPDVGAVNLLAVRSRIVTLYSRQLVLKRGNKSASSGECVIVCSDDSSEPVANPKPVNPSSLIPVVHKACFLPNYDIGLWKEDSSGLGPDGSNSPLWLTDTFNSEGSSKAGSVKVGGSEVNTSKSSKLLLHSGHFPDSKEATDRCSISGSVSVSFPACGHSKAVLDKDIGAAGNISSSRIGDFGNCINGDSGPVCEGTAVLNNKAVCDSHFKQGDNIQNGDRGGGKVITKAFLKCDQNLVGKRRLKAKSKVGKSSKVALPTIYHRGSTSTCYGEQSEESDIQRNNGRQWDILKREVGERLWEAMTALGVVECEGRNSMLQGIK